MTDAPILKQAILDYLRDAQKEIDRGNHYMALEYIRRSERLRKELGE